MSKKFYSVEEARDLLLYGTDDEDGQLDPDIFSSDDESAENVVPEVQDDSDDDDSEADPDFQPMDYNIDDDENSLCIEAIASTEQVIPTTQVSSSKEKPKNKTLKKKLVPENDFIVVKFRENIITGRNNIFKWNRDPKLSGGKVPSKNVIHIAPGPTLGAKTAFEPIDCFRLFFPQELFEEVFTHTNEEISRQKERYKKQDRTVGELKDMKELEALLGLIILSGGMKNNHLASEYLFDVAACGYKYRATMSERKFKFLINALRFDDKITRSEDDKFAPVRKIWDILIDRCKTMYKPGSYITIDEQLVGFRGRVPFLMYIPSKPNKYGMKIVMACDTSTKYLINASPYLGKGTVPLGENAGMFFVDTLTETIQGSNRNITIDNWFTSVPLVSKLLEKKLSVVGTIKKNKPELPPGFVDVKYNNRTFGSNLFIFDENMTAVSFKAKQNKLVTLVSSMHDDDGIDETSCKPHIILTYNQTKGGVDSFDQMCQNMNCGRKTRRWPLCVFYNMLNIAYINAYIIYVHNFYWRQKQQERGQWEEQPSKKRMKMEKESKDKRHEKRKERPISRLDFMILLSTQLCNPWRRSRLDIPTPT